MVREHPAVSTQHSAFSKIEGPWKVVRGHGPMLSSRTRILFASSSLAPASVLIWRLYVASVVRGYKARGELTSFWAEPGILFYVLLLVGLLSFALGIVSLVMDIRGSRK